MKAAYITQLPRSLKLLISIFLLTLSIGYFSALFFVNETTSSSPQGIVENYNGNEDTIDAEEMKFKKSKHEMLNIIHTHIISMSILFLILAFLVYGSTINQHLRSFLIVEPMISVIFTFGGIYLIWLGFEWMKYVVILSGALMTASYIASIGAIIFTIFSTNKKVE